MSRRRRGRLEVGDVFSIPVDDEHVGWIFDVVDYTGRRRRRATKDEVERLPYRAVVAPIRFEKAFRR